MTNHIRVLLTDVFRSRSSQEVKVKNTSQDVVFQVLLTVCRLVDFDIHTIRVQQENSVRTSFATVVNIDRVVPVKIRLLGDAVRIAAPQGAGIVRGLEAEGVAVLTKSVEVRVVREGGTKIQILRLKDKIGHRSVEQDLIGMFPYNREGERILLILEFQRGI